MKTILFSDFDGTITEQETFSLLMKEFAPEASRRLIPRLLSGETNLREGVPAILETIPSARFPEMVERMRSMALRPGFSEFLDLLERFSIPLVVLSGSLEELVMARLAPYQNKISRVVAARAVLSGEFLRIHSGSAGGDELVHKAGVMREYGTVRKIAVGDSVTDLTMAREADLVFARSILAERMKKEGRPYRPFENFFEISNYLEDLWKKDPPNG
ncbi:MAG: HAD-IB family phosphatase [Nitrospirae bacterium]|nr:MAG: putative hydrolase, haloacid dehalogenase-like protein family [Leptospirillum sp. Group IV 'UBA BS']MCL4485504.1 HAD-IB family phosphatase [Nitrospirota bacterium]MCL5285870.1 HAD-IB family phosphatase [Nitrospirota bacterium]